MRSFLLPATVLALAACNAPATDTAETASVAPEPVAEATASPAEVPDYGPAGTYVLDPTHASLTWKVSHFGLSNYTARFTALDAKLVFDPEDLAASSLEVTVDPSSVETDYPADYTAAHPDRPFETFDQELSQSESYFNSGAFPEISFRSSEITQTGPATGTVTGDLTFLGVTKPVTLNVAYNGTATFPWAPDQPRIGFSATGTLKRSDFGLDIMVPNLGDAVDLLVEAEFVMAPDAAPAESE